MNDLPQLIDLSAEEQAKLNGGYYCRVVQVRQCYWTFYGLRCRFILQTRCF